MPIISLISKYFTFLFYERKRPLMDEIKIPKATARRLPLYYRYLIFLNDEGKEKVSSTELAEAVQVDSASIRRDFSYFGALGKRGYGYDVKNLLNFFKKILNQDIRISAAFDINPEITGTIMSGVPVYDMSEMKKQLREQQITIAILCVPQTAAQKTANEMFDAGIKGIMNFTPLRLSAPSSVRVQNVDLATELQTLIYFLDSDKDKNKK